MLSGAALVSIVCETESFHGSSFPLEVKAEVEIGKGELDFHKPQNRYRLWKDPGPAEKRLRRSSEVVRLDSFLVGTIVSPPSDQFIIRFLYPS